MVKGARLVNSLLLLLVYNIIRRINSIAPLISYYISSVVFRINFKNE